MREFFSDHLEHVAAVGLVMVMLVAIGFEIVVTRLQGQKSYDVKDTATNFAMYAGYFAINLFWLPVVYSVFVFFHDHSLFELGQQWWTFDGTVPAWHWGLLFVLDDFCYYVFHRTSHAVRLFWASHVTHHSSERFNLSVAFRQTWLPFYAFIFWIPLALIGFEPLMIMTMQLVSLAIQGFLHTEVIRSYGPLDTILNSPSHHRVHHGTQEHYVDKNFGGVLIVWDRLFGTFAAEGERPVYGVGGSKPSYNPLRVAFGELENLLRGRK